MFAVCVHAIQTRLTWKHHWFSLFSGLGTRNRKCNSLFHLVASRSCSVFISYETVVNSSETQSSGVNLLLDTLWFKMHRNNEHKQTVFLLSKQEKSPRISFCLCSCPPETWRNVTPLNINLHFVPWHLRQRWATPAHVGVNVTEVHRWAESTRDTQWLLFNAALGLLPRCRNKPVKSLK